MKKLISIILILLSTGLLGAEKITLQEALDLAYENNYDYKNAKISKENVDLQVKEGYKSAAPTINYNGGYTTFDKDTPGLREDQRFNHTLSLNQPLYTGGLVTSGIKIAKTSQELTKYKLRKEKSGLKLEVIDAYLKVLAQKSVVDVYRNSQKEVDEAYKQAARKFQLKVISKSDYLPLKTKKISNEAKILEVENQEKIYMIKFKQLIGLDTNTDIELENLIFQKYNINMIDVDSDIRYATLNNDESKISELNKDIALEKEKISRADMLPKINGNINYKADDRHLSNSGDQWYWTAGISVNWKIFDFGKSWDAYTRSKNVTRMALNNEKKIKDNIEVKIRTNYINLIKLNSINKSKEAELEATEENYKLQKKKYNNGIISIIDYLLYETQLNNVKLGLIKAKLDYYYAYEKYLEEIK